MRIHIRLFLDHRAAAIGITLPLLTSARLLLLLLLALFLALASTDPWNLADARTDRYARSARDLVRRRGRRHAARHQHSLDHLAIR